MNDDRIMPHDLDAEAAVLSAMMLDPAALDVALNIVQPAHFYSEANRRIGEAAHELAARGQPVDIVSLAGWLRDRDRLTQVGGAAYLATIVDCVPSVANVEVYANTVRDKWRIRELIRASQIIAAEGFAPMDSAQSYIDQAGQAILRIALTGEQRDAVDFAGVLQESHRNMLAAEARGGAVELSTGLRDLDKQIGGLSGGRLTILAARPGMGKTALATGIAESIAASAGPVIIFSQEMPRAQLGMRMACARAGASVFQGLNGWLQDRDRANVLRAMDDMRALPIWIDDTPALTLMRLRAKTRTATARAGRRPRLIVVDYLQLMTSPPSGDGRRQTRDRELSEITAGLKQLGKELDCAVLLLSQLNREVEAEKDKRPRMHHLRESGGIEQDADDVLFLYRDEYYHANSDDKGIAEVVVAKQRNGPTGVVRLAFHGASTFFDNAVNAA